jgi:hypothetical protein
MEKDETLACEVDLGSGYEVAYIVSTIGSRGGTVGATFDQPFTAQMAIHKGDKR